MIIALITAVMLAVTLSGCSTKEYNFINKEMPILEIPEQTEEINITITKEGNVSNYDALKMVNLIRELRLDNEKLIYILEIYNNFAKGEKE